MITINLNRQQREIVNHALAIYIEQLRNHQRVSGTYSGIIEDRINTILTIQHLLEG